MCLKIGTQVPIPKAAGRKYEWGPMSGMLADDLGQVRHNQQQGGGKKDESCLAKFGVFEHDYLPFLLLKSNDP